MVQYCRWVQSMDWFYVRKERRKECTKNKIYWREKTTWWRHLARVDPFGAASMCTRRELLRVDFSSLTWPMPRTYCTLYCSLSSIYSFLAKNVALLSNVSLIVSCYSTVDSTCWWHDVCSPQLDRVRPPVPYSMILRHVWLRSSCWWHDA